MDATSDKIIQSARLQESPEQLVARGTQLLKALACDAHAAKLEARRAELELAIVDAQAGRMHRLIKCIQFHESEYLDNLPKGMAPAFDPTQAAKEAELPSRDASTSGFLRDHEPQCDDPWQTYRFYARQRLALRVAEIRSPYGAMGTGCSDPILSSGHVVTDYLTRQSINLSAAPGLTRQPLRTAQKIIAPLTQAKINSNPRANHGVPVQRPAPHRQQTQPGASKSKKGTPAKARTPAGPRVLNSTSASLPLQSQQELKRREPAAKLSGKELARILRSGLGLSLVVHIVIVIGLAVVHLKLPSLPAALSFEASPMDSQSESFEISPANAIQPAEPVSTPEIPSEPVQNVNEALDAISPPTVATSLKPPSASQLSNLAAAFQSPASSSIPRVDKASASFFGVASGGNNFCYIVDGSGSMRGHPWDAAKRELMRSLASLTEKQRFYIIILGKNFEAIPERGSRAPSPHALYATHENIEHARRWIETIQVGSGSPPNDALEFAISKEPDCIYLLTDGVTRTDVCGFLQKVNRIHDVINGEQVKVPVHAIAFFSLAGQNLMRRIAAENQGQFIYIADPKKRR